MNKTLNINLYLNCLIKEALFECVDNNPLADEGNPTLFTITCEQMPSEHVLVYTFGEWVKNDVRRAGIA